MQRKRFIPDLAGIRVLVVDDNEQAPEILCDALRGFALQTESASSAEEAIQKVAAADSQSPYRLVLMDWHMTGMDGLEASRLIMRGGLVKHVPKILVVTAFGREDSLRFPPSIAAEICEPASACFAANCTSKSR